MAAQRAALLLEPAPDVREMLRDVLEDDGYTVQTVPNATAGLQVLRDSAAPLTVLFDVTPLAHLSIEQTGLALLQAIAHDSPDDGRLARHGYVLMSSIPERALATVETVPANLHVLRKPFGLESLRARLEAVDEWLRTHTLPQEFASEGRLAKAYSAIEASRDLLAESLARKEQGTAQAPGQAADADAAKPTANRRGRTRPLLVLRHLRAWRQRQGLSQKELAAAAGLHPTTVSRLELGAEDASSTTVAKLAAALGIAPEQLLHQHP